MPKTKFTCTACKQEKTNDSDFTTGYGKDDKGNKICFDCCGDLDRTKLESLKPKEKAYCFYLTKKDNGSGATLNYLTNWPGTFKQLVYVWKTVNNWGYNVYHFENNGGKIPFYGRVTGDSKECVDFVQRKVN